MKRKVVESFQQSSLFYIGFIRICFLRFIRRNSFRRIMRTLVERLSLRRRLALEVFRQIRQNQKKIHLLKQLFWECTQRCNVHCKHCGSDCKSTTDIPDMPAADFLRVIDSITPHEVSIVITRGEPLVRKDLEKVGLALYQRGYPWGMVTNGLYLTASCLQILLEAVMKPKYVIVSIHVTQASVWLPY